MERYQGTKIDCRCLDVAFTGYQALLERLNHWAVLLSQLGLTPIHAEGAYGNQSCRTGATSFLITRSAMVPRQGCFLEDYCHVVACDVARGSCQYLGASPPSSETLLHHLIYHRHPTVGAILHGHSPLLLEYAERLDIPSTAVAHPYGTVQLAHAAVEMVGGATSFFNLKEHGFVALGKDCDDAGRTALAVYARLLSLLLADRHGDSRS